MYSKVYLFFYSYYVKMASKYFSIDTAYDDKATVRYLNTRDIWPIPGSWWRNDPLSDKSLIRPNRAGYYPYKRDIEVVNAKHRDDWTYSWQTVCSTIVPDNPQYAKTKEVILYR